MGLDLACDPFAIFAFGTHQFEIQLEAEPEAGGGTEVAAEAQIVFWHAAAAALFHVREMGRGKALSSISRGSFFERPPFQIFSVSLHEKFSTTEWTLPFQGAMATEDYISGGC